MSNIRKIIIDQFDSAIDGHFTLRAYSLSLPTVQEQRQSIAGMDGDLDYTEALSGRPHYNTRQLKATLCSTWGKQHDRMAIFERMAAEMHGKRCRLQLPDKPGLCIFGRLTLELKTNHPAYMEIEISGTLDPYFRADKPKTAAISILPRTANALEGAEYSIVPAHTTAENYIFSVDAAHLSDSAVGSTLVCQIFLDANTTYFFAARVTDGRGSWGVGKSPDGSDGKHGIITTDSTGILYMRFVKSSTDPLRITPIVALPTAQMLAIDAGNFSPELSVKARSGGTASVRLIIGDNLSVHMQRSIDFSAVLDAGANYVAATSAGIGSPTTASGIIDLSWEAATL